MSEQYYTKPLFSIFDTSDSKVWRRYENEKGFLKFISPIDGNNFSDGSADVYVRSLPFYNEAELIQVRYFDENTEHASFFFLKFNQEYAQLKGNADTIHEMNRDDTLNITIDNVFDYLKFFNMFTFNDEGHPFYVIDGQSSEFITDYSEYEKSRHLRKFNGSVVEDAQEMGVYKISTRIMSAGILFDCRFEINADGYVEMIDDTYVGSV